MKTWGRGASMVAVACAIVGCQTKPVSVKVESRSDATLEFTINADLSETAALHRDPAGQARRL